MKVLHLSVNDIRGGAARAAYHLHEGLRAGGVDSRMLVQHKFSDDASVSHVMRLLSRIGKEKAKASLRIDALPLRFYPDRPDSAWSVGWFSASLTAPVARLEPDLVQAHWICDGFASIKALAQLRQPLVWTLHDAWAFTGGCHYPYDCERYRQRCGACPQLASKRNFDLSRWGWNQKKRQWRDVNFTVVTPSRWLAECAKASALFHDRRVEVIPNGLNLTRYRPLDQDHARAWLGLPADKKLILFGAMNSASDRRKGFQYLQTSLRRLATQGWAQKAELVIFGASRPAHPPDLGMQAHYLGYLYDDASLALLYAAADTFVLPSVQDNLPNTVMEALACGVPCVAFAVGGTPDMVEHERTGYLAQPYEVDDLAKGIAWVLEDEARRRALSRQARQKAENEFGVELQAQRYIDLYREILSSRMVAD